MFEKVIMSILPTENLNDERKHAFAIHVVKHRRNQHVEAEVVLEEALLSTSDNFITMIRETAQEAGGINFEPPARHALHATKMLL